MAVLVGTVSDSSSGKPVADALVTVTSPNLQGEEIAVTDATGVYRIPGLPPGKYTMRVELQSFRPYAREELDLHADTTIRLNASLLPESLKAEEVVVVGRTPTVDIGSSATGLNITSEITNRVPLIAPGTRGSTGRSFEAVADMVPNATADMYGVGMYGSSSPENKYLLDGLSVNNATFGILGTPLNIDFVKEVSVLSGGYMPEYGRSTGGILNAITKSGTNEWHGSAFSNWTPGAMNGHVRTVKREGQTLQTQSQLRYQGDIGGDVGGPLIKDKLWIYAGFDWSEQKYNLTSTANALTYDQSGNFNGGSAYIPGSRSLVFAKQDIFQQIAKLTWAANNRNRVDLTVNGVYPQSGGNGNYGVDQTTGLPEVGTAQSRTQNTLNGQYGALAHKYQGKSTNVQLKWHSELDGQKLYLDTWLGFHNETLGRQASDGTGVGSTSGLAGQSDVWWVSNSAAPNLSQFDMSYAGACTPPSNASPMAQNPCPVPGYRSGGPEYTEMLTSNRVEGRSILTILARGLGHHVIKVGINGEYQHQDGHKAYTGGTDFQQWPDGSFFVNQSYGYLTGPDQAVILNQIHNQTQSVALGAFAQDSWSILDTVTANLGLRYDSQLLYGRDGNLAMSLPKQFSPRAGLIWDPTQEGHAKIYTNYARYYEQVPLRMLDRYLSGESVLFNYPSAMGCDPSVPGATAPGGACSTAPNLPFGSAPNSKYTQFSAGTSLIDPKIKAPSTDEFVLGGDYEIFRDGRLGINYAKRWLTNTIEDMSPDGGSTFLFGNPGYGLGKGIPKAVRKYDAMTLYFSKAYAQGWVMQASYTLSFLRGNYGGLFRSDQFDPHQSASFDLQRLMVNSNGWLPGDNRHYLKFFGAKDIKLPGKWGFVTPGLSFRAYSGSPTNYLGSDPNYGPDTIYLLKAGSGERLPWVASADLRLAYGYQFTKTRSISATIDIFNIFNFQSTVARDERYTSSNVNPSTTGKSGLGTLTNVDGTAYDPTNTNPNFGRPTQFQAPRTFRFGLKGTF